jgi:hypothetical protein
MSGSCEIKQCIAVVSNPVGKDDRGEVTNGHYFVENNWVTLCSADGVPLRSEDTGARYTVRLEPGDSELTLAKRLTLRHYRAANREDVAGFGRVIRYGRSGLA